MKYFTSNILYIFVGSLVLVWFLLKVLFVGFIPEEILQDFLYWILLLFLITTKIYSNFPVRYYLYLSLFFIILGAILSVFSHSNNAEVILRFAFVFLVFGTVNVFFSKNEKSDE